MREITPSGLAHFTRDRTIVWVLIWIVAVSGLVFALRWNALAATEPRTDQAHYSVWVQDVKRADHVFPDTAAYESRREAYERDTQSVVHHVLRRIYNQPQRVFNLGSLASIWMLAALFGDTYSLFVLYSIGFSVLGVLLVGLVPLCLSLLDLPQRRGFYRMIAVLAPVLMAGSYYLHYFSPQGWHNIGIAYLLAHFFFVLLLFPPGREQDAWRISPGLNRAAQIGFSLTLVLAFYSYYVLPWLALPAGLAQIAASAGRRGWVRPALRLALFVTLIASPVIVFAVVYWSLVAPALENPAMSSSNWGSRAYGWFAHGAAILSPAGLLMALVGLWILARRGFVFPLAYVLCFGALSVPSSYVGETAWYRLYIYAVPFLMLGLAASIAVVAEKTWAPLRRAGSPGDSRRGRPAVILSLAAAAIGVVSFSVRQAAALASPELVRQFAPEFYEAYLQGDHLRAAMAEIDRTLPEGAALCPGHYPLFDLHRVLTQRSDLAIFPPLETMEYRREEGTLLEYWARRRPPEIRSPLFLLIDETSEPGWRAVTERLFEDSLGWSLGVDRLALVGSWDTRTPDYGRMVLYSLPIDPRESVAIGR